MNEPTIKLLIATDMPDSLAAIGQMLASEPEIEIVATATTGQEAVALAKEHQPDVVVMDYDMPGFDGADATRAILLENEHTQVIMLSVVNDVDDIRHAMRAGARDYLIKPLQEGELVETIQWLIRERREYARMTAFVEKLRKAYEALFWDDKPVPPKVVAFLEAQVAESPGERLTLETLADAYARNRDWAKLAPLADMLARMEENEGEPAA